MGFQCDKAFSVLCLARQNYDRCMSQSSHFKAAIKTAFVNGKFVEHPRPCNKTINCFQQSAFTTFIKMIELHRK